jgi:hypothetical protein
MMGQSIEGIWKYEVLNTLSGDYFGDLIIEKVESSYKGKIINEGRPYLVKFNFVDKDSLSIWTNVAELSVSIIGKFIGEKINGNVAVAGDPNIYKFTAEKKIHEQLVKVVDAQTNIVVSYANIFCGKEGMITNETGLCRIKMYKNEAKLIISGIGYKTDTFIIMQSEQPQIIKLKPIAYVFPVIEVNARGFSAKKIVVAAINRLEENYIQKSHNADLFFRSSTLNDKDSLIYQSESILQFYDAKGYRKRGWRNIAKTRFAKLEQTRIVCGPEREDGQLIELGNFFVFWADEPIVANHKPLSKNSIDAYEFELVGIKEFMGHEVYEIDFLCKNLKERHVGLPSIKYMNGKFFVNKEDYAILKYEEKHLQDFEYRGKYPKKRGNLKERTIHEVSRIEIFSKNEEGYYLSYSKKINKNQTHNTLLTGELKIQERKLIEEYQYFNISTKKLEPLTENLFKIDRQIRSNPDYWKAFNIIINEY